MDFLFQNVVYLFRTDFDSMSTTKMVAIGVGTVAGFSLVTYMGLKYVGLV